MWIITDAQKGPRTMVRMNNIQRLGKSRKGILPGIVFRKHDESFILRNRICRFHPLSSFHDCAGAYDLPLNDSTCKCDRLLKSNIGIKAFFEPCRSEGMNGVRDFVRRKFQNLRRVKAHTTVICVDGCYHCFIDECGDGKTSRERLTEFL